MSLSNHNNRSIQVSISYVYILNSVYKQNKFYGLFIISCLLKMIELLIMHVISYTVFLA